MACWTFRCGKQAAKRCWTRRRALLLLLAAGMPALPTDAQFLGRALSPLLANAYKFSGPDTEVLLRLHGEADWAVIEVIG